MKLIRNSIFGAISSLLIFPGIVFAQLDLQGTNSQAGLPAGSIVNIIRNIMLWMLGIVGFIGIIGFAISGILYLTAAGDETRIETAKKAMTWSIVGVIVALMGAVIIRAVDSMLSGTSSTF